VTVGYVTRPGLAAHPSSLLTTSTAAMRSAWLVTSLAGRPAATSSPATEGGIHSFTYWQSREALTDLGLEALRSRMRDCVVWASHSRVRPACGVTKGIRFDSFSMASRGHRDHNTRQRDQTASLSGYVRHPVLSSVWNSALVGLEPNPRIKIS